MGYQIGGIQQVGIGVENLEESWKWYIDKFGMDCRIFDDDSEAKIMTRYTGGSPARRRAILVLNLQSGGGFELWMHKGRKPLSLEEELKLGDLGILACKMKAKNIDSAFSFFRKNEAGLLGDPIPDPSGARSFFLKDPWGNIFQIIEDQTWFMNEKKETGGSAGAIIGVSDIDKARVVYSSILGYDKVIYDETGIFNDLAQLPGGNEEFRRVLLEASKPFSGPFYKIFGQSKMELICSTGKPGMKVFRDRLWGDPGFIQLCFDVDGIDDLKDYCQSQGHPFTVDSRQVENSNSFDMGEAAGHFAYIEDYDGTLIEFVETHRLPILKKLGWYLDLRKKNEYKPLPDWVVKLLRFSRV